MPLSDTIFGQKYFLEKEPHKDEFWFWLSYLLRFRGRVTSLLVENKMVVHKVQWKTTTNSHLYYLDHRA